MMLKGLDYGMKGVVSQLGVITTHPARRDSLRKDRLLYPNSLLNIYGLVDGSKKTAGQSHLIIPFTLYFSYPQKENAMVPLDLNMVALKKTGAVNVRARDWD